MDYMLLVRGYAEGDIVIWLAVVALLLSALGGRWLVHRIAFWVQQRRMAHLWPFK